MQIRTKKEANQERFAAKNTRRRWAREQAASSSKAELKLAREIRQGFSGKFGREKKNLKERALPGTFQD